MYNKELVSVGGVNIYWYSVLICIGILLAIFLIKREAKRHDIDSDFITNLSFYTIIFSIIGARLYYCLFNLDYYGNNIIDIFKIWNGGLAIHGAIIAGLITILLYSKKHGVKPIKMLDIVVVGLILAQAIGRWGNFFNKEAYGVATTLESLKSMMIPEFIIDGMKIGGVYYTPTFLYESIWCLIGFVVLISIRKFYKRLHIGSLTAIYFVWYGIGRLCIEFLRTDSLMLGRVKVAQLVSIIMIIIGVIILIKNITNKNKFDNLYNSEKQVI